MVNNSFDERKNLTFEQAEGTEPLPSQLQLKEVSSQLRALLWEVIHTSLADDIEYPFDYQDSHPWFKERWPSILYDNHVKREHQMVDEFANNANKLIEKTKTIFTKGDYLQIFGFLQFVLRHEDCPSDLEENINRALNQGRAAYRVIVLDKIPTIVPMASEEERLTLKRAFTDLTATELHGARTHLRQAAEFLTEGKYADSTRESIHAVESVVRVLAPSKKLSEALIKLERLSVIDSSFKVAINALYGYASNEKGVRHGLLGEPEAKVMEVEALTAFGICCVIVSYLINRARLASLLS
jgi:hypothetical protein